MNNKQDKQFKKIVVAFSGGLDTSFCVVHLKSVYGCTVITATVDTGGFNADEISYIGKRSKELGASKHYFLDGRKEVFKSVRYVIAGNILRGGNYAQSTAIERLATVKLVAKVAKEENADAVCHGSTGAGNDQLRFDLGFLCLLPNVEVLAPIRELGISRVEETQYLLGHGFKVPSKATDYSYNEGLWGNSVSAGGTQDPWMEIPDDAFLKSRSPEEAPDTPTYLTIGFETGIPVSVDDESVKPLQVIAKLNELGFKYGVGRDTVLTTSTVGLKARIGIEEPAAHILIASHRHLESITLTWDQIMIKDLVAGFYREFIHRGLAFDPVVGDIEALLESSQQYVTGEVRVKLYKGHISCVGCRSPYSLVLRDIGSYSEEASWSGEQAKGFARIQGFQSILANLAHSKVKDQLSE